MHSPHWEFPGVFFVAVILISVFGSFLFFPFFGAQCFAVLLLAVFAMVLSLVFLLACFWFSVVVQYSASPFVVSVLGFVARRYVLGHIPISVLQRFGHVELVCVVVFHM